MGWRRDTRKCRIWGDPKAPTEVCAVLGTKKSEAGNGGF